MIRPLKFMLALGLSVAASAAWAQNAGNPDLGSLQHELHAAYHLEGHGVPMMGLVSGFTHLATKGGVRGMRVVTYENLPDGLDREGVARLVRAHLGSAWTLMLRDRSTAKNGEEDMVWVQPSGKRVRLLVVDLEAGEMDLVQMDLSPEALKQWQDEHGGGTAITGAVPPA